MLTEKSTKILIKVLFVLSLVTIFNLIDKKEAVAESSSVSSEIKQVGISSSGFNPKSLEIKQGESVTFTNQDEGDHWPASNIHPTHDVYPEFDTKQPLKPNQSWTFKFDRVGEWYYHDHLNPGNGGVVKVTSESTLTSDPVSKKINLLDKIRTIYSVAKLKVFQLYYSVFPNQKKVALAKMALSEMALKKQDANLVIAIKLFGPEMLMGKLNEEAQSGPLKDCHAPSHQIGRLSYQVLGNVALNKTITSCSSGYIHGTIAAFIKTKGTENLGQKLSEVCEQSQTQNEKLQCYHGAGHGLMAYSGNDLPSGVKKCQDLQIELAARINCLRGIFMENINSMKGGSIGNHPTKWLSKTDLHFPCNRVDQSLLVQDPCYIMQASWIYAQKHSDQTLAADECLKAAEIGKAACFKGLGQQIFSQTPKEAKKIVETCFQISTEETFRNSCLSGAQNMWMNYYESDMKIKTTEFCEAEKEELKTSCFKKLEDRLRADTSGLSFTDQ